MIAVNVQASHRFDVYDTLTGLPVTGLTAGNFTITLRRLVGSAFAAASETVTVTEDASGRYFASYTPANTGLYTLDITHASHSVTQYEREDWVGSGFATTAGPYLTTRANVKLYAGIEASNTQQDATIDSLLDGVTKAIEQFCGRVFFESAVVEYPEIQGDRMRRIFVARPPIVSMTGLWVSTSWPRVYDATTALVAGTDFEWDADEQGGCVEFASERTIVVPRIKAVKVSYTGGFAVVPGDVELAARRIVCGELARTTHGGVANIESLDRGDGSIGFSAGANIGGYTVDLQSKAALELRRLRSFAC